MRDPAKIEILKHAQNLLNDAKSCADSLNTTTSVQVFSYSLKQFESCVNELVYLNEEIGVRMSPPPRDEMFRIVSDMDKTIHSFMVRALSNIEGDGILWAEQVDAFIDKIVIDAFLSKCLREQNKEEITRIRQRTAAIRTEQAKNAVNSKYSPEPLIDIEQIIREEKEWRREQTGLSPIDGEFERIDGMGGHEFECWCARLLEKIGFMDVEVTKASGDQGVDILAARDDVRYAVQCKCYSSDLGNKPVQEVHAGKVFYRCHVGCVMTNQRFTQSAKELARATGVFLWDRDWIESLLKRLNEEDLPI